MYVSETYLKQFQYRCRLGKISKGLLEEEGAPPWEGPPLCFGFACSVSKARCAPKVEQQLLGRFVNSPPKHRPTVACKFPSNRGFQFWFAGHLETLVCQYGHRTLHGTVLAFLTLVWCDI